MEERQAILTFDALDGSGEHLSQLTDTVDGWKAKQAAANQLFDAGKWLDAIAVLTDEVNAMLDTI